MKLAFVTSLASTSKPDTGFEIANAAIIDALRAEGHHVTVFAFARPDDELKPDPDLVLLGRITIENHAAGPLRKIGWLAAALLKGMPFASAKLWLAGAGDVTRQLTERGRFDRIILNSVMMPGACPALSALQHTVLVAHNIEHASATQNASHAASWPMRWLYRREAEKLKSLETNLAARCGFIWCLADEDRHALAAMAGKTVLDKSAVLPLVSTSVPAEPAGEAAVVTAHDIGLIGTWTWEPNLIGLKWFLAEVAPLLPATLRIAVAGRTPADLTPPPNVTMLGRVPDAAAFLRSAHVIALASRAGTGVQLKTIEALQLGLPAVATSLSMRGLGVPPANVRLADDAAAFAAALAGHVEGCKAGQVQHLDGSVFMREQANSLARAINAGLATRPDRSKDA